MNDAACHCIIIMVVLHILRTWNWMTHAATATAMARVKMTVRMPIARYRPNLLQLSCVTSSRKVQKGIRGKFTTRCDLEAREPVHWNAVHQSQHDGDRHLHNKTRKEVRQNVIQPVQALDVKLDWGQLRRGT